MGAPDDVTELLIAGRGGDPRSADQLLTQVYAELRALAAALMQGERPDHTLQPTALVHEAYLKLVDQTRVHWRDRAHFFAVAAEALRRVLVDHARAKRRQKRGGGRRGVVLQDETGVAGAPLIDLLALDEALGQLAHRHPQHARIVELRFFAGLTVPDVAAILDVTERTVERKWRFARAWLRVVLTTEDNRISPDEHDDT